MSLKLVSVALAALQLAAAMPAITLEDLEMADDTMAVGSYVRETRAAAPEDYDKSYQSEGDGEIGYSRKKGGGGKKGYQHFDSYHKKAGDNYEFEKQDSYGHDEEGQNGAHSHNHERRGDYTALADDDDHRVRSEKTIDVSNDDGNEESRKSEKIIRRPVKFVRRVFKWFGK